MFGKLAIFDMVIGHSRVKAITLVALTNPTNSTGIKIKTRF